MLPALTFFQRNFCISRIMKYVKKEAKELRKVHPISNEKPQRQNYSNYSHINNLFKIYFFLLMIVTENWHYKFLFTRLFGWQGDVTRRVF